ncbi:MAG: hypothetical protein AB1846_02540 [Chloroflexota bacterium]
MSAEIIRSLAKFEIVIYISLAALMLYALRNLWRAWRETRGAVFVLERELALRRLSGSITALVFLIALAFVEFVLATFIAPALPAASLLPTPTVNLLVVPTGTLSPEFATAIAQTVQAPSLARTSGCIPGQMVITAPQAGAEVTGQVELVGTVNVANFGFYKYEVSLEGTQVWSTIRAERTLKNDESLGVWDTTELAPGDYLIRLVVVDNEGISLEPCIVPVKVVK